jgi:hypothetical protein
MEGRGGGEAQGSLIQKNKHCFSKKNKQKKSQRSAGNFSQLKKAQMGHTFKPETLVN